MRCSHKPKIWRAHSPVIELHGVTKRFESGQEALRDVNVAFDAGSMCFLTGHSGAGKSTFLKMLLRLDTPTRGQILVKLGRWERAVVDGVALSIVDGRIC